MLAACRALRRDLGADGDRSFLSPEPGASGGDRWRREEAATAVPRDEDLGRPTRDAFPTWEATLS